MGILDEYKDSINVNFSDWIQINDNKSGFTIEDFSYSAGVDEDLAKPHCWRCVTVNNCYFKNEESKRPEEFDYSKYTFGQIAKSIRGLYHPNCHCKKKALNVPRLNDININITNGKIKFFFDDKLKWYYEWGYEDKDKNEFIKMIKDLVAESYRFGNYECEKHTKFGYQINVFITINGVNEKKWHQYPVKSCFTIFPDGKLKCNTVIGDKKL